jgi:hypothetical protein
MGGACRAKWASLYSLSAWVQWSQKYSHTAVYHTSPLFPHLFLLSLGCVASSRFTAFHVSLMAMGLAVAARVSGKPRA